MALGVAALPALAAGCGSANHPSSTAGIPAALLRESRPIGRGPRFQPPVRGPVTGACAAGLGRRYGVHVELFAADRVVIVARGIGTRAPLSFSAGRIARARCYGDLVTLEPTGVVLVRRGARLRLAELSRAWGQPLSRRRLASFAAPPGREVVVFVGGRRWPGEPGDVPLSRHAEIVLEVGPFVPPHRSYLFPPH
jgi:hypothetical protein